jgi:hypothetical protein
MTRCLALSFAAVALMQSACTQALKPERAPTQVAGGYSNPATWLHSAQRHETQGDLQRALYDYRLARTLSRDESGVEIHLRRVESKISARTSSLLKQAQRAERNGKPATAKARYLDILGLQPNHQQALAGLRQLDKQRALAALKSKRPLTGQTMGGGYNTRAAKRPEPSQASASTAKRETGRPDETDAKQRVEKHLKRAELSYQAQRWDEALSHLKLAEQAGQSSDQVMAAVQRARKQYAESLYNHGVISFRSTPQKAIDYWRYAIKFDPEDSKSRLRIRSLTGQQAE